MIQSDYLELAIGLAVISFLGALAVSGVNEGINWLTRVRAKFLWAYLYDLFDTRAGGRALPRGRRGIIPLWTSAEDHRPTAGGRPFDDSVTSAPTDAWLARLAYALDPVDAPELTGGATAKTAIKHVPPPSLAQAMLEVFADIGRRGVTDAITVIASATSDAAAVDTAVSTLARRLEVAPSVDLQALVTTFRGQLAAAAADPGAGPGARTDAADALVSALLGADHADSAMRDAWRRIATEWPDVSAAAVDDAVAHLARAFPQHFARMRIDMALTKLATDAPFGPTLRRLWEAAQGEIEEFRTGLETYFDADMKRLSGYYRRSIRIVMFGLASLLAVLGGIDAISVTRDLWRNPADRASLVERADDLVVAAQSDSTGSAPDDAATDTPGAGALQAIQRECAEAHPVDEATITSPSEAAEAYGEVRTCVTDALDELSGVGVLDQAVWIDGSAWGDAWTSNPLLHFIGTLLAALALMLGAPFWFDVIKRLTGLRRGLVGDT